MPCVKTSNYGRKQWYTAHKSCRELATTANCEQSSLTTYIGGLSDCEIGTSNGWRSFADLRLDSGDRVLDGKAVFVTQIIHAGAVLNELIGPTHHQERRRDPFFIK